MLQIAYHNWDELEAHVSKCTMCDLHKTRTQTVFGVGNHNADWLFVGEAPGANEDKTGVPFVGRAGKLLDELLRKVGLSREEVYIANILKCRPPSNRDPLPEEALSCNPFLRRQVELVQPKIIVPVGRIAAQLLLKTTDTIGSLRNILHFYENTDIPVVVTYHPAYLLRNPAKTPEVVKDLKFARTVLGLTEQVDNETESDNGLLEW